MPGGLLVGALPRAGLPNHWRFCRRSRPTRSVFEFRHAPSSDLPADRGMVNDLDRVPVRILEVARASPVAMRAGHGVDGDAAALQKCRPPIDITGRPDDESQMIQRA